MKNRNIDLRSDTVTLPKPEMIKAIAQAELGDDILREDPTVKKLEKKAAEILGMEDALLVISGTMANQIALMSLSQRGEEVIMGYNSHMYNLEGAGIATLSQVQVRPINIINGYYNPKDIEDSISVGDIQKPKTALICIENPYNLNSGVNITVENMRQVKEIANKYNIPVYLDGARIFNAAVAMDVKPVDLCKHVDAMQFCLTKGLGCPLGSILAGNKDFIEQARVNRQRLGGGMRQAGIIAAPGIYALDQMIERLEQDNKGAKQLGKGIASIPGIELNLDSLQTNIISFSLTSEEWDADRLVKYLNNKNIQVKKIGSREIRMIVHYQITESDIDYVISIFNRLFNNENYIMMHST
ncbi:low specificity L-threonine aldolase [Virgibacillus oceani]